MAKLKTPLLSLDGRGSLASAITFTRRRGVNIAEKTPIPQQPNSLAQMYQRWLYQDYVYRWHQLGAAEKQIYAMLGSPHRLTAFQYFMRYMLTNLPDLLAWWKLDDNLGATTIDSSRNSFTSTIFGASPAAGLIDGGLYFDGINDRTVSPLSSILQAPLPISLEFFFNCPDHVGGIANQYEVDGRRRWTIWTEGGNLNFNISSDGQAATIDGIAAAIPSWNAWHHAICQHDGVNKQIILNGVLTTFAATQASIYQDSTLPVTLGRNRFLGGVQYNGYLDNFVYRNRTLAVEEALRLMERRYPL